MRVILLADDDFDDLQLLEEAFLEADPLSISAKVSNGQEALEYLGKCDSGSLPCAIVLDYNMPVFTGAEVLEKIRRDSRYGPIPKFVWSTSNASKYIKECLANGALNYFVKPDTPAKLSALAKEVLSACGH